jgi:putative permease
MVEKKMSAHIIRAGFISIVILMILAVLYSLKMLLIPILISLLLTFFLQPVVLFFENRGFKRILILTGIYVFVTLTAAGVFFLLIPVVTSEARNVAENMPHYERMIRQALLSIQNMILEKFPGAQIPDLYEYGKSFLFKKPDSSVDQFGLYAAKAASLVSMLVLIPVFTFFFLADGHLIKKAFLRLIPNRYFEMIVLLQHKIFIAVQSFIRGQMVDALAVGILTSIGLAIIGMPFFIVIGIIAGIGNLIPYFGPLIGFIPAFLSLLLSPEGLTVVAIVKVVVVFTVVQFIEGTFVYPIAVGKSVNMHPLVVIIGVAVGGQIGGIPGMLMVIPVIAIAKVTVEVLHFYLKRYSIL